MAPWNEFYDPLYKVNSTPYISQSKVYNSSSYLSQSSQGKEKFIFLFK